jgi:hypothetical protein
MANFQDNVTQRLAIYHQIIDKSPYDKLPEDQAAAI